MNRDARTAQLVATGADWLNVQGSVVVAMVVALRGLAAIDAFLISERQQNAGNDSAANLALTQSTTDCSKADAVPTTLGVAWPHLGLTASDASNLFVARSHLTRPALPPKDVRPEVVMFELAARRFFDLERAVNGNLVPLRNRLVADAQRLRQGVLAAEMADNFFKGLIHE